MISRRNLLLLINRKTVTIVFALGAVLIVAAVITFFLHWRDRAAPPPEITPPQSLTDLAEQYPQLRSILANPELDSVYKEFLVAYQRGGDEAARQLAQERGMLTPDGDVAITLVLDTEDNTKLVPQLEAAGITVVSAYRDRINVAVPLALIEAHLESEEPGKVFDQLTELEHVISVELPAQRTRDGSLIPGEGVGVIGADAWHQAGFTGAGLRIGVLDLGFAGHEALLGEELPDDVPLATFGWYDDDEVHGTACAEIIHEVAPDAALLFAWYDGSDAAMGEAVDWMLDQGVDIVSHSASGLIGPRDGSEWDAQLVDSLAAQGILWVNSSGNEALSHYRDVFTDEDGDGIHEFRPGEERLALYNNGHVKVVLMWEDDWEQASQDYELFLYDYDGNELASSQAPQSGEWGHEPVEWISYATNGATVYAVVTAYETDEPVVLDIFVNGAKVAYPTPAYSVCPPGDAVGSLTVGAANWDNDSLADYSSQGPTTDGRLKPEISAPTGVSGATYGMEDFHGTSASCPHVAGTAALVWQAYPEFTRQEVTDFMLANTIDLGEVGPDTGYGYGRLQLPAPPASVPLPRPTVTPLPQPEPGPTATPPPLPTPTPVIYTTPTPPPITGTGAGAGLLAITGLGLVAGGLCCTGAGLLLAGGVGLVVLRRRGRQEPPAPPARPRPAPSAPPTPPAPISQPPPAAPDVMPAQSTLCPTCGASLRADARFCPECGRSLPSAEAPRQPPLCPHCGTPIREGARFCRSCGAKVKPDRT
ncbi:MAG TPA: zinc-ribbon domain-containing protein [Chloroflexi bacterium]|nr:zinc-ribbon domain-containing protein [Chloroflexota bacterium]